MKNNMILLFILYSITVPISWSIAGMHNYLEPKDNEVFIGHACIEVPLGRMLLIRKDLHYCTLKFARLWTEKDGKEKYAAYEVYYQGDGTGDFLNKNVIVSENRVSELPLRGPFRPFIYQPGNSHVQCGPFRLGWEYKKKVCFIPSGKGLGDFGFELAPTPWTNIKDVNTKDPRVKWYRYDEKRERIFVPIDKLW